MIVAADLALLPAWLTLRTALWPDATQSEHDAEAQGMLARPDSAVCLLALGTEGAVTRFAEASLHHDHVNGCDSSPVLFLEGIYVHHDHRRQGVARALCDAIAEWGRARNVQEFASDAPIANPSSHALHHALGFAETERVVFFRKPL